MKLRRDLWTAVLFLCIVGTAIGRVNPSLTLSSARVQHRGLLTMHGSGFTPGQNVSSHLRKPDRQEFPVLPILTDQRGDFTHKIDTLVLAPGVYELWAVDDASKASSTVVQFEVIPD